MAVLSEIATGTSASLSKMTESLFMELREHLFDEFIQVLSTMVL